MSRDFSDKLTFIRRTFGRVELSRDGMNAAVSCPKCRKHGKKKFAIRLDDDRVNCWVCGLHGRLLGVLQQYRSSEIVREYITKFAGKNIRLFIDPSELGDRPLELPQGFRLLAPRLESGDIGVRWAVNYLLGRGLTLRDLWYFKFGIATDPEMKRRVVMPSFDGSGELNYYTGRAIDRTAYRKYMNCDAEKKAIVFNEINIDWGQELTLVEGPFDLVRCESNTTCLLGSSLSEDSLLFGRIYQNRTPIVLALDRDMEQKSWQRIAKLLASYDVPVRIMDLGKFSDVGEMTREQFLQAREDAVPWDRTSALVRKIRSLPV